MRIESTRIRVLETIADVPRSDWDALLGSERVPFVRWDWLNTLEASGSATVRTGWEPRHITVWRGARLVAASPAWRKHHSMGEHIYDFSWAEAAESAGIRYYPKLLLGVPLSPITSPRFLIAPTESRPAMIRILIGAARELARDEGCSSVHVIFPTEEESSALEKAGLARRLGLQYHWRNPGYTSYEDYLSRFSSKRRAQLRRERAAAGGQGISLVTRRGPEIGRERADLAWKLYESTCLRKYWGRTQLTRGFFRRLSETMPESIEMVEASKEGRVVGGAFNVVFADRLYGRYWGCFEDHPFLHFNVCLYHSIDECIQLGRRVFEPGAGGEHKIPRGFEPAAVHSAHEMFDPRLDRAVRQFVERERRLVERWLASPLEATGMRPWVSATPARTRQQV